MKHGATFSRCCGLINLSPVGSDVETPKASHTNPGVDETKCADFVESKLEIGGVETALLIKSISTFKLKTQL